jgi:hypothetical protein
MPQPQRLLLPDIRNPCQRRDLPRYLQQLFLALPLQRRIQLVADVEVVFHRAFAAAGDEDDVLDARSNRLFHPILNDRLVDQRQHLLGNNLGCGQEARAQATCGKHCLADFLLMRNPIPSCYWLRTESHPSRNPALLKVSQDLRYLRIGIPITRKLAGIAPVSTAQANHPQHRLPHNLDRRKSLLQKCVVELLQAKRRALASCAYPRAAS